MKKTLVILITALTAATIFAAGQKEDDSQSYFDRDYEEVSLTGTLEEVDGWPALSADGKTYLVMAPMYRFNNDTLPFGEKVSLTGIITQPGPWGRFNIEEQENVDGHFMVRTAEYNGETIDLGEFHPMGPGGFRGTPMMRGRAQGGYMGPDSRGGRRMPAPRGRW